MTVGPLGLETTGAVVSETDVECPRKVAFAENTDTVAAVVLRGGEDNTVINARPVFVLLGEGVERIEIRSGGAVVGQLDVNGHLARWPALAPSLERGKPYEIAFIVAGKPRVAPAVVAVGAGVTIVQP